MAFSARPPLVRTPLGWAAEHEADNQFVMWASPHVAASQQWPCMCTYNNSNIGNAPWEPHSAGSEPAHRAVHGM